jgi:hypothetical protein
MELKQRAELEIEEFSEKYPDIGLDSVPQSVWDKVKDGENLSSAYKAYDEEKKRIYESAKIKNEENAARSSGRISGEPKKAIYTAKEVASMSESDVRKNYDDILYSMNSKGFYS